MSKYARRAVWETWRAPDSSAYSLGPGLVQVRRKALCRGRVHLSRSARIHMTACVSVSVSVMYQSRSCIGYVSDCIVSVSYRIDRYIVFSLYRILYRKSRYKCIGYRVDTGVYASIDMYRVCIDVYQRYTCRYIPDTDIDRKESRIG